MEPIKSGNPESPDAVANRWAEYRGSFLRFVNERAELQKLIGQVMFDHEVVEKAATRLEFARIMHNDSRDDLATALPGGFPSDATPDLSDSSLHRQIADVAELLWQCRGRSERSALEDWLLAEKIVHAALTQVQEARGE